jgi:hypothetical protein
MKALPSILTSGNVWWPISARKKLMMLRNHGTLSAGMTAAECWLGMFYP